MKVFPETGQLSNPAGKATSRCRHGLAGGIASADAGWSGLQFEPMRRFDTQVRQHGASSCRFAEKE
jgi:hypothetical protein